MKLFFWAGYVPRRFRDQGRVKNTSACACFPTIKAFKEYTGFKQGDMSHVSVQDGGEGNHPHLGARIAFANPGLIVVQNIWDHTPGEQVYVVLNEGEMAT